MYVRIFNDMAQCTDESVRMMLPMVSEQRRARALQYKFTFGQFACLKSYIMLVQILEDEHLVPNVGQPCVLNFGTEEHGKPYLIDFPNLHFSISHCRRAIAVAVDTKPIGVDVECFCEAERTLLERTMNVEEISLVRDAECPDVTFAALWTKKEAVLKLRGTGIVDDLRKVLRGREIIYTEINKPLQYACSVAQFPQ